MLPNPSDPPADGEAPADPAVWPGMLPVGANVIDYTAAELIERLIHRGLTRADIARGAGVDEALLSKWARRKRVPRAHGYRALARFALRYLYHPADPRSRPGQAVGDGGGDGCGAAAE